MVKQTIVIAALLVLSINGFAQTQSKQDSILAIQRDAYIDSALKHTSVSQFKEFIESIATVKQYPEVKFVDAFNTYVQQQYNAWIATKSQPKK